MCYLNIKTRKCVRAEKSNYRSNRAWVTLGGHCRPLHCRENRDEPPTRRTRKCAFVVGSGLIPPHLCSHVQAVGLCGTTRIDNLPTTIAAGCAQSHRFGKERYTRGATCLQADGGHQAFYKPAGFLRKQSVGTRGVANRPERNQIVRITDAVLPSNCRPP